MKFIGSLVLACSVLFMHPAHASLFTFQQQAHGADKVEIAIIASDLSLIKQLFGVDEFSDVDYNELNAGISFGSAWNAVPVVPNSLQVSRPTDGSPNVLTTDAERKLAVTAVIAPDQITAIALNDVLFKFTVARPTQNSGLISLDFLRMSYPDAPLPENFSARLAELEPNNLTGVLAQTFVAPTSVPLPGAYLFMMTGGLLLSIGRRKLN